LLPRFPRGIIPEWDKTRLTTGQTFTDVRQRQMPTQLAVLRKYASTFRKMINSKVGGTKRSIRQSLGLNKDTDWDFLTAAMDIIDDASAAISNFQQFGLSGPTKYKDIGEKYLRLYGILSATYMQQQSILTISQIMHVIDPKQLRKQFDAIELRTLRHKLSAHSTDYLNRTTGIKEAYVPLQIALGDQSVTAVRHGVSINHETINLSDAIDAHTKLLVEVMDTICAKTIKTLFKGHHRKYKEFTEELSDLRIEKNGGHVFKGPKGAPKLIITVATKKHADSPELEKSPPERRAAPNHRAPRKSRR
jgi:hypothetical protein